MVEATIVLAALLMILFAMLDLCLAAARSNALSECVRRAGRLAIISGEKSPTSKKLGPTSWTGTAADNHAIANAIRPLLLSMKPSSVQVTVTWPDGGNRLGQRVYVTLNYQQRPLTPVVFGTTPWQLTASSTMRVVH
jgi:Flp pilus assembly protein TadG